MYKIYLVPFLFVILVGIQNLAAQEVQDSVQTPLAHFGFQPGTDRMLLDYESLILYMQQLAERSPRVKITEIGESPMGKKMYLVFFSSEENISKLERLKYINRELAINPNLSAKQQTEYSTEGKVFIMATLSMHSTEVGPSQASPLIAYQLATSDDPDLLKHLNDVVYMMVPSSNPDGMDMIVNHYMQSKDTKYEGGSFPRVYHKYTGHDNNRDYLTLTQKDTKAIARIYNTEWYPQVLIDKHQMGSGGPRYFVPPMHDPIAENVDEKIWNWSWIFGSNMAKDMAADSLAGVSQNYMFDDYWPGSTETGIWKNVIAMLTECASAQLAKPIYIEKNELTAGGAGLADYKKSINMPMPWEGGWWRLSDILDYEIASTFSLIKTASLHKKDILTNRNILAKEEVEKGKTLAPAYYVFPAKQHDRSELLALVNLLDEHGVDVYKTTEKYVYQQRVIESGEYIVPLAQPYRAFIKEALEKQNYPEMHFTNGGEVMRPYDITSWSLPLHKGVDSYQIDEVVSALESKLEQVKFPLETKFEIPETCKNLVFSVNNNESFKAAFTALKAGIKVSRATSDFSTAGNSIKTGDFIVSVVDKNSEVIKTLSDSFQVAPLFVSEDMNENIKELEMPNIALVETAFHDADAGWTRFVFDSYNIPFTVLKPEEVASEDLTKFDVIVFPDNSKSELVDGKYKRGSTVSIPNYDPKYIKGMGKKGQQKLMKFENEGGTIISWGGSTELFLGVQSIDSGTKEKGSKDKNDKEDEEFELPVSDISSGLKSKGAFAPGTLFNIDLKAGHPLTLGMEKTAKIFSDGNPVFSTSIPYFDTDRRVIATYTNDDLVASGYAEHDELLEGKPVMVWAQKGEGNFVFYGFYPQFRASTPGTYKLLFNALLLD
ncbi:M14 family metallopeptidase [Maribellus sediminis]|uniref:M14 family metallopeptidase n=1 Tax=Maribellus sediminis TaxID=2696285 RepID=UPI00143113E2|nr:M14 metallopeptidase family protein [Maribellus sediminis]